MRRHGSEPETDAKPGGELRAPVVVGAPAGLAGVTAPGHLAAQRLAPAQEAPGGAPTLRGPGPRAEPTATTAPLGAPPEVPGTHLGLTVSAPLPPAAAAPWAPAGVAEAHALADTIGDGDSQKPVDAWRPPPASLGDSGPRYLAQGELGRGGMGRVLEALDRRLDRVVAVKESFATDDDGRQRFEREVAITARLEHPSIVPLYDAGVTADGRAFYVMRKVSGRGLDRVMSELPTLDDRLGLLPAMLAACDAVAHAHARQVVHRDLKPGNILIGDYGETMVIDWGLAKALGESEPPRAPAEAAPERDGEHAASRAGARTGARTGPRTGPRTAPPPSAPPLPPDDLHTVAGSVFGTPGFMSPEQARGETIDPRADVYALGATLYHLLAGRPPHVGKSATEVIDRVRLEPPPPLSQVCPGAPAELVAIVEKAMAFELSGRYPDASALAGDLRRFLAGQLVAAHRYTWWQRLRRAARTYRAAFLVAGASLLVLAVLGAVSVLRIVSERDTARQARQVAVHEAEVAKVARDQAAARADELVVAQAQALVADNPTAAVGLLKRLPLDSPVWPRARMVVMGAVAEGVARAVPSPGSRPPAIFAMSPGGERLLVGEDHGRVWVLELEELRVRELASAGSRPLGCWVNDGAAVLLVTATGVSLRELGTGRARPVPFPTTVESLACPTQGPVAVLDTEGAVWWLDPALAQARKIEQPLRGRDLEATLDGALLAVSGERDAVVLDRNGAIRQRVAGEVLRTISSPGGRLAVMLRDRVVEVAPGGDAVTTSPLPRLAIAIYYVGERLRILSAGNRLSLADGTVDVDLPFTPAGAAALGEGTSALGLADGSVWLAGWWGSRIMRTPAAAPIIRMAGQPGAARLAGWARGTVLVWNLGGAIPRRLETETPVGRLLFLGEDRLAMSDQTAWRWLELSTGRSRRAEHHELPLFNDVIIDPERGDAMLLDYMLGRAMLARWTQGDIVATWREHTVCAALLGGGAVAVGTADGRVAVGSPEAGLALLRLANPAVGVARLGDHGVLAVDGEGEILTYDLVSGVRQQSSLGEPPSGPIASDGAGGVVIAAGARLLRWHQGTISELTRLAEPVLRLARYRGHLAIQTSSDLFSLDLASAISAPGAAQPRRIAGVTRDQQLLDGSRWAIGVGQRGLIELVDIATGVRWSKSIHGGLAMFAVSPNGSRVAQVLGGEVALWSYDVPERPDELRAFLDQLTNAAVHDDLDVTWTAAAP